MTLRRIEPLPLRGLIPNVPTTEPMMIIWVHPDQLYVDEAYQRSVSEQRGIALIRRAIGNFDWAKFKIPSVVPGPEPDTYRVIDGQHSAIIVASHPYLELCPVALTAPRTQAEEAAAFLGANRDRVIVTRTQLHHSALVAEEPEAVAVAEVCAAANIRILKNPPPKTQYKPGDCVAVRSITTLIERRGRDVAVRILAICASRCPVSVIELRAAELILFDPDFRHIDNSNLAEIVAKSTEYEATEAEAIAATHEKPIYRALAVVWARRMPRMVGLPQLRKS